MSGLEMEQVYSGRSRQISQEVNKEESISKKSISEKRIRKEVKRANKQFI